MDSQFPYDENGDVLRRMAAAGVDLVSPRVLDFEHCFPDEESAKRFCDAVSGTVLEARLIRPNSAKGTGWEVQCRQRMIPTHAAITGTETRLAAVANRFGGYPNGWGSMSNPDGSPTE
jgi:hypothetical protein